MEWHVKEVSGYFNNLDRVSGIKVFVEELTPLSQWKRRGSCDDQKLSSNDLNLDEHNIGLVRRKRNFRQPPSFSLCEMGGPQQLKYMTFLSDSSDSDHLLPDGVITTPAAAESLSRHSDSNFFLA
ncbi:glycoside hydrolase family 2 protein [Striga asiatica]|uniref:Glycoside hydrolase family 2 protein n=1 Tax=Striga asiatica TaxID=4170 RepID=A0A5A7QDY8_STRAF|nr:glycoside hydrolase family 2 protein [Striga asiatica]